MEIGGETREFPEELIQHIQCFLSAKEAALSTILSKSWYTAWLTRPNLDFAEGDFRDQDRCVIFARKTMQRYEELNRKIQSFRLKMLYGLRRPSYNIFVAAEELIARAMKLGATDVDIDLGWGFSEFVLPHEVLESQTLLRFSLDGAGRIDLRDTKVSCSRLKSLALKRVGIAEGNLWDIISNCPSIEELELRDSRSSWFTKPDIQYDFHKLRVLLLELVEIGDWFFPYISGFPCLKELTIRRCRGYEEIQICSTSLECISLEFMTYDSTLSFKFDLPRIRKFKFIDYTVPSLSFTTTSRECHSDIKIRVYDEVELKPSWFHELREFLLNLSPSEISLSLDITLCTPSKCIPLKKKKGCNIIPRVEKLKLLMIAPSPLHYTILENLFWSCRPNFITRPYLLPSLPPYRFEIDIHQIDCKKQRFYLLDKKNRFRNNHLTELLCNTLLKNKNRNMSALYDLEEANVEFFDVDGRPLPWKTLLEASSSSGYGVIEVCFRLKWRRWLEMMAAAMERRASIMPVKIFDLIPRANL